MPTTKKKSDNTKSRQQASLKAKGKKVNKGVNPATKLPHTTRFLKTL